MNQMPQGRTIAALLQEQARVHGQRDALVAGSTRITYAGLDQEVRARAHRFCALGVQADDKVAILMGNRPEWITTALAIASIGATVVTINTWATAREIEYMLGHADVTLLIAGRRFLKTDYAGLLGELEPRRQRLPLLRAVLGVGSDLPDDWQPLLPAQPCAPTPAQQADLDRRRAAVRPIDVAIILFTSGSTSVPKGVQFQHGALIEAPWHMAERHGVVAGDRVWLGLSLFWAYGCANVMMGALTHGAALVLQEHFEAGEALRLIEQQRCTVLFATSNMVRAMYEHPERPLRDLSTLRSGAAAGNREQRLRALELAPKAVNCFGMTETYGHSHATSADDPLELTLLSCGRPVDGFQQKIVGSDGRALPPGQVGELRIKGFVTPGYYKQDAALFDDEGYLRTGDLACVDENGYMFFHGRSKEVVRTGGINVAPSEVESVLLSHPSVHAAYVIGLPDPERGELLAALLVPKPGCSIRPDTITTFCRERLAAYKIPRRLRVIEEKLLPQTSTGKVHRRQLGQLFADAAATD